MVCNQCGAPLEGSMKFCQYCGTEINQENKQGKKINSIKVKNIINRNKNLDVISDTICDDFEDRINKKEIVPKKSKVITIVLMLTLGLFGAHKFYLQDIKNGILYIVGLIMNFIGLFMLRLYFEGVLQDRHILLFFLFIIIGPSAILGIGVAILRDLFNYCYMNKVDWCNTVGYIEKK